MTGIKTENDREERPFTEQFLKAGFASFRSGQKEQIKPTLNWFGVSVYAPDWELIRGDKKVVLSLNGILVPANYKYYDLMSTRSCKYIGMFAGGMSVYEDWTGNLPSKEVVQEFIKEW